MQVLGAVAEFERDLLIERTNAGIHRARQEGKRFGRPASLSEEQKLEAAARVRAGTPVSQVARDLRVSRQTVMRAAAVPAAWPT
jgi:putative DNA-invertase from lambdoid prophage Rac